MVSGPDTDTNFLNALEIQSALQRLLHSPSTTIVPCRSDHKDSKINLILALTGLVCAIFARQLNRKCRTAHRTVAFADFLPLLLDSTEVPLLL